MKTTLAILFSFLLMLGTGVVPAGPMPGTVAAPAACYVADEPPCCVDCRCCLTPADGRAGMPFQPAATTSAAQDHRLQPPLAVVAWVTLSEAPTLSPRSALPCPADFPPAVPLFQRHCLLLI